ncbi:MAG: CoA ligase [Bacteroidetes bacterium 4572_128]|nr:MAG: CoA ligase [Bacteroidetes bacterium 4572_128]
MINEALKNPKSIVVIGGSNNVNSPGGKVLKNLIDGNFKGKLYVNNPKQNEVQGIKSYKNPNDLPNVDLAILAIPAKFCPLIVEILADKKTTRAFIILSAGFSEVSEEGKKLEDEVVKIVNSVNGVLIGPNCIGVLTPNYNGVFTEPIPKLNKNGCDFVSGSGATAVFIIEAGIPKGLSFANIYSVGNSAQMCVEDLVKDMDENFNENSSKIKLLYLESIKKPHMLLKHSRSLIKKGCKIAAIKAGSSDAGIRAASSHTGALASSDLAVDALFKKAGIVRCFGREELVDVASVFMQKKLNGRKIAIITHAGGPAVILTDALSKFNFEVPEIKNEYTQFLLEELFPGSSVANPIDFLATGTAKQLDTIINYVDNKFDEIDGMVVIFGSPGLTEIFDVYKVLDERMKKSNKAIFPVLPSLLQAKKEIDYFLSLSDSNVNFSDEYSLAKALAKVYNTNKPAEASEFCKADKKAIRFVIDNVENGYISPKNISILLDAVEIPRAKEGTANNKKEAIKLANEITYPLVMKVVGPVHKSDVGGVVLNVNSEKKMISEFERMMKIENTTSILFQAMMSGTELFVGAKYEENFGHLILCGMGGIFIEILKDVSAALAPLNKDESLNMIRALKSYKIIQGIRGQDGIDENKFSEILLKLSTLLNIAPEIKELDLNPLLGKKDKIIAVDARIRIEK